MTYELCSECLSLDCSRKSIYTSTKSKVDQTNPAWTTDYSSVLQPVLILSAFAAIWFTKPTIRSGSSSHIHIYSAGVCDVPRGPSKRRSHPVNGWWRPSFVKVCWLDVQEAGIPIWIILKPRKKKCREKFFQGWENMTVTCSRGCWIMQKRSLVFVFSVYSCRKEW